MLLYQFAMSSGMKPEELPRSASGWFSSNELVDGVPEDPFYENSLLMD